MNTYKAIQLRNGGWGVHMYADGVSAGLTDASFPTEAEALYAVYVLARAELQREEIKPGGPEDADPTEASD